MSLPPFPVLDGFSEAGGQSDGGRSAKPEKSGGRKNLGDKMINQSEFLEQERKKDFGNEK